MGNGLGMRGKSRVTPLSKNPPTLSPARAGAIAQKLSAWFEKNQRPMPWRATREPYRIWLSEVMLQQTRVQTVIPYYEKFTKRFPTVEKLAHAPLGEVLKLWAGLGYYARARQLHKAARVVASELGGRFPKNAAALGHLPGIGLYTAGAIASIAFDLPAPAVDGNVVRVLSRLLAWPADTASPKAREQAAPIVQKILEEGSPRVLTQALMELGATLCTPALPPCGECPLRGICRARRTKAVEHFPKTAPRKRPLLVHLAALALVRGDGHVLLCRSKDEGLFGGLWQLPTTPLKDGESTAAAARGLAKTLGAAGEIRHRGDVRHVLTHRDFRISLYSAPAPRAPQKRSKMQPPAKWIAPQRPGVLALSRMERKLLAVLSE